MWDEEETYIYDGYCQANQFVGALRDYPGFKMASGADYRFDSSRDGCSNEVKPPLLGPFGVAEAHPDNRSKGAAPRRTTFSARCTISRGAKRPSRQVIAMISTIHPG